MTLQKMLEIVRQHHPNIGETEAIEYFNDALADYSENTGMAKTTFTFDLTTDQRYYDLPKNVLSISRVEYDTSGSTGKEIPRLVGKKPEESDIG